MATLKLASLGGGNTVTVTEGANTASDTGSITLPAVITDDNAYYAQAAVLNQEFSGIALNIGRDYNKLERCFLINAPSEILLNRTGIVAADGSSGNTFVLGRSFSGNEYSSAGVLGATARVLRVVNGAPQERLSEVVAANVDCWPVEPYMYPHSGGSLQRDEAIGGTTIRVAFGSGWRIGVPYYIGIAAVTEAGSIGPITHAVTTTISSIPSGTSASVTHSSIVALTGEIEFSSNALAAPTGVTLTEISSGVWEISCNAVSGAFGYRAFASDVNPANMAPSQQRTITLADDGGFAIEPGKCQVFLDRTFLQPNSALLHFRYGNSISGRNLILAREWWARATPINPSINPATPYQWNRFDPATDPAPEPGLEWYMARSYSAGQTATQAGDECSWISTASDTFYEQSNTSQIYDVEFWHSASESYVHEFEPLKDSNAVFNPGEAGETTAASYPLTSTATWQKAAFSFRCATALTGLEPMRFGRPNTNAVTLKIAGFKITRRGEQVLDLIQETKDQFSAGGVIRWHQFINGDGHNIDQLTIKNGMGGVPGIDTSLKMAQGVNGVPYLQVQFYRSAAEWQNLAAFLAAPVSSGHPYALRRQANGQTAPWVDVFSEIQLENGNEPWNLAGGYIGPVSMLDQFTNASLAAGEIYGLYTKNMIQAFKASPYWPALSSKLKFYVGGHIGSTFGLAASSRVDADDISACLFATYIGGDFASFSDREENGTGFYTMATDYPTRLRAQYANRNSELAPLGISSGVYEGGIGYSQQGGNSDENVIENEILGKSRAATSGTLDSVLGVAAQNAKIFTYFSEGTGDRWNSRALPSEGGQEFGPWRVLRQIQEEMGKFRVREVLSIRESSISVTTVKGTYSIPPYGVYRIDSITYPGRVCIAICPHDIDRSLLDPGDALYDAGYDPEHELRITTGLAAATSVRKLSYCGRFDEHNRYAPGLRLNAANGLYDIVDPTCVEIAPDWVTITPPSVARIDVNADIEPVIGGPLIISFRGAS